MGELIILADRRADRSRRPHATRPGFFFDLACPYSYLAAEQVERSMGEVEWIPTRAPGADSGIGGRFLERDSCAAAVCAEDIYEHAEARAAELRLPLVWPDRFPGAVPSALRAAAYAAEQGAAHRFAIAASRLAFCGGFDLEDPEILVEAAAAAALPLDECLAAARDRARDQQPEATARGLLTRGMRQLPVIQVGNRYFEGDAAPGEAAALLRLRATYGAPLAPVG